MLRQSLVVEGMQGLAELEENEVGDVHHVVDRPLTDRLELLFEPVRGLGYFNIS